MSESFDEPPWWLIAAVVSLGFPMSLLLFVIRPDPILLALVLPLNPFLWAGRVEWMLRRHVDRPRDSDAACPAETWGHGREPFVDDHIVIGVDLMPGESAPQPMPMKSRPPHERGRRTLDYSGRGCSPRPEWRRQLDSNVRLQTTTALHASILEWNARLARRSAGRRPAEALAGRLLGPAHSTGALVRGLAARPVLAPVPQRLAEPGTRDSPAAG